MLAINYRNEVVPIDPNSHFLAFEKCWTPLMPYIMADPLEMGMYSIETNERFKAPFVWNNIKIISIEIDKTREGYEYGYYPNVQKTDVYKIDAIIYPYHYWERDDYKTYPHDYYTHTFYVKNGLFFFVDSILRTINRLINDGCSIETINFDFLDKQCECWNGFAANRQSTFFYLPSECHPSGYYQLIEKMKIEIYKYGHGSRNGSREWKEVEMTLQTIDEYVIHIIYKIINSQRWWQNKHEPIIDSKTMTTKFTFKIEKEYEDAAYIEYNRVPVDSSEKKRIMKIVLEKLIVNGIKMITEESAILYHSIKH